MTEFQELVDIFNKTAEGDEKIVKWIPARHVITQGALCVASNGLFFLSGKYGTDFKSESWPFDGIGGFEFRESAISSHVLVKLQSGVVEFVVEGADGAAFVEVAESIRAGCAEDIVDLSITDVMETIAGDDIVDLSIADVMEPVADDDIVDLSITDIMEPVADDDIVDLSIDDVIEPVADDDIADISIDDVIKPPSDIVDLSRSDITGNPEHSEDRLQVFERIDFGSLFSGINAPFKNKFDEITVESSFGGGDFIFKEGGRADFAYSLIDGRVRLTVADMETVYALEKGELFGWSSLIGGKFYTASAKCEDRAVVLKIDSAGFRKLLEESPENGIVFYKRLCETLGGRLIHTYNYLKIFSSYFEPFPT